MSKLYVLVDVQNDFITGSLGTKEAVEAEKRIEERLAFIKLNDIDPSDDSIAFTWDCHDENYLDTQEGAYIPVLHCQENTEGIQCPSKIMYLSCLFGLNCKCVDFYKDTFGCNALVEYAKKNDFDEIELLGFCTDICVISNALMLRSALPESSIVVDASCCAGTTPELHKAALDVMKSCNIIVRGV